jgi:phage shock protein C
VPDPKNPLRRSRDQRMIAGVCGGFAEWLGWDVTLVRILYVVGSILSAAFPGLLAYVILWIVMPDADPAAKAP